MQRNAFTAATKHAIPTSPAADDAGGALPAELRFLAAQATDAQERERIVRAYYAFAHGTPESATVQFAPLFAAVGFYLLLTADTRRRTRMAHRQRMAERENAKVREIKEAMDAKEQAGSNRAKAGGSPQPGEAATDAARLKNVFRQRQSE